MVEFGEKFENLLHDVRKYAELKIDSIKLQAVENISQLLSDIFSIAIIFFLLFISAEFLLTALMLVIAQYIGLLLAAFSVGATTLLLALYVYYKRKTLFRNIFVGRFCKIFFNKNSTHDETN